MADAVESPLPGDRHGGFGERPGETDREQSRHRAPGRLNQTLTCEYGLRHTGWTPRTGLGVKGQVEPSTFAARSRSRRATYVPHAKVISGKSR
jgi:hypothetical protein